MHPGDLVGVQDPKGPQLAVVDALQGSKIRLRLGFEAKAVVLHQRQLELIAALPAGHAPPQRLDEAPWQLSPETLNTCNPARRNWGAAWLLLRESGETVAIDQFADLICAAAGPTQQAACWLTLHGPQLLFRVKQGQITARSTAELRPLRRERRRKALEQALDQAWLQLLKARQPIDRKALAGQHQQRLQQLIDLAAGHCELQDLDDGLQQSLQSLHLGHDRGDLRHRLEELGQWDPHRLVAMERSAWSHGFSAALKVEAEHLLSLSDRPQPGDDTRLDLSGQHCVTIDDDDTRDIDDGLALERHTDGRLRLWIHVADPGRLVPPDSPLDLEARRRGSSLYLASGMLPMFPEPLCTGPFSLRAGQRCAALSTWVELAADGAIAASGVVRSWVRPSFRLSYSDADELIDLAPPEEPDLAELDQLLERRRRWRVRQGALLLDLPEGRIRNRDGKPVLEVSEPSPARLLVAEAMILAGAVAAHFACEHQLALPFRSQLPADLPPARELEALPAGAVRFAAIKRCLSRGLMGTQPCPHFSLGLEAYAQATSPIRRYGDLLVQRQIVAQLEGGSPLSSEQLQDLLTPVEAAVREGIQIARDDQRHWQQVWFEAHKGEQWRAQFLRWLRPGDHLGLLRIDELALDVAADCPAHSQPGDALLLRVQQVDSLRDLLRLVASAS